MYSMIALQERIRTRSSLLQLTCPTPNPMEVKHTFAFSQILCQLKVLNFRCLALLFGTIFSDTIFEGPVWLTWGCTHLFSLDWSVFYVWLTFGILRSVNKPRYPQHNNRRLVILGCCLMEVSFMILYEFKERQGYKVPSEFFLDKKKDLDRSLATKRQIS